MISNGFQNNKHYCGYFPFNKGLRAFLWARNVYDETHPVSDDVQRECSLHTCMDACMHVRYMSLLGSKTWSDLIICMWLHSGMCMRMCMYALVCRGDVDERLNGDVQRDKSIAHWPTHRPTDRPTDRASAACGEGMRVWAWRGSAPAYEHGAHSLV